MSTRRLIILILVVSVIGTLFLTNPQKGEYVAWVIDQSMPGSGHFLSRVVRAEVAPMYLDDATVDHNCILFSVFRTATAAGDELVALGVCKQFVLIRGYGIVKE